jgi:hypothetical protein
LCLSHRLLYILFGLVTVGLWWSLTCLYWSLCLHDFQLDFGGCTLGFLECVCLFNFYTQAIFLLIVFVDIWLWLVTCYQWVYSRSLLILPYSIFTQKLIGLLLCPCWYWSFKSYDEWYPIDFGRFFQNMVECELRCSKFFRVSHMRFGDVFVAHMC